jgi:tetratricopeptide (TPR) repeat protein
VLQTLGERAMYLYFPELSIPALEKVGAGVELSLVEAYNEMGDTAGAAKWAERALKENPYDWYALNWQKHLAEKNEDPAALLQALKLIDEINKDPGHWDPVVLSFDPETPEYEPHTTIDVGGTKVFDHSYFGVRMRNTSHRPVVIESVTLKSAGTAAASGLGDIRKYWSYPSGTNRLEADESVYFQKQWGFTVDTGHEHVRYIFRTCWHGEDTTVRQCRTQSLDVLP